MPALEVPGGGPRSRSAGGRSAQGPRTSLSSREARWLAIDAQGLSRPRGSARVGRPQLRELVDKLGMVQLDAIRIVERTQFIVPFSRLGPYDIADLQSMSGPGGDLLEGWGHAASLVPMARQPLFRWRTAEWLEYPEGRTSHERYRQAWWETHADYARAVLAEVTDRGPLTAAQLGDPRRQDGTWWEKRSIGRQALEMLSAQGDLAGWRMPNFEVVYDLPERVIPRAVLDQPTPPVEEAHRRLLMLAAGALGVATASELGSYYAIKPRQAKARVAELVEAGELLVVDVVGWKQPAYVLPGIRPRSPSRTTATLLSPFDSLIWDRVRTKRLFGFAYRIEVYVPGPKRQHGYYVLPLLLGGELVGRLDLKADRNSSTLQVLGAFIEEGQEPDPVAFAAAGELDAMRGWLGLTSLAVANRGNLARGLRTATRVRVIS